MVCKVDWLIDETEMAVFDDAFHADFRRGTETDFRDPSNHCNVLPPHG